MYKICYNLKQFPPYFNRFIHINPSTNDLSIQVSNVKTCKYNTSENNVNFNLANSYKKNYPQLEFSKTIACICYKYYILTEKVKTKIIT